MSNENKHSVSFITDITKTYGIELRILYQGSRIVCVDAVGGWDYDAVEEMDDVIKQLLIYQKNVHAAVGKRKSKPAGKGAAQTYVYLMRDKSSGLIKIGRSINPKQRERTLIAEKSTIQRIYTSPLCLRQHEKHLHKKFESKRVRGEWFNLDQEDVKYITKKHDWNLNLCEMYGN